MDVLQILGAALVCWIDPNSIRLARRNARFAPYPYIFSNRFLSMLAVFGAISATLTELVAINRGIWSYGSYMPIVPLLKIGLLPLLQLTILLPTALWFALTWHRRWQVK